MSLGNSGSDDNIEYVSQLKPLVIDGVEHPVTEAMRLEREVLMAAEKKAIADKKAETAYDPSTPIVDQASIENNREIFKARMRFATQIRAMNDMYAQAINFEPTLPANLPLRLSQFKETMEKEIIEADEIIDAANRSSTTDEEIQERNLDYMTAIADWLGDMIVFCRSEALKFGIPMEEVLDIIMESNMSKLGADGKAHHDGNGKMLKGPNYFKPEPKIRELLKARGVVQGTWVK